MEVALPDIEDRVDFSCPVSPFTRHVDYFRVARHLPTKSAGNLKWTFQSLARGLRTRDAKCESGKKPALGCTTLRIGVPILLTPCGNLLARAKLNLQTIASRV
jgi:hypothetical protein